MNIETLVPMNDRILIEVVKEENKYDGLVHLAPQLTKEASNIGLIKSLPVGYTEDVLKVGMKVYFPTHSGSIIIPDKLASDPTEYRLIKKDELLGFFHD